MATPRGQCTNVVAQSPAPSTGCLAGCWAGCWPRSSVASSSTATVDAAGAGEAADDSEVVLDVGFANVRLRRLEEGCMSVNKASPSHAFHIEALSDISKDGLDALLNFLGYVLRLPDVRRGFIFVYDLRLLGYAQRYQNGRSLITRISSWVWDPQQQALWSKLCHSWYVLYPRDVDSDDVSFQVAKTWLWMLFFSHPPGSCPAYIIADPTLIGKIVAEDNICFLPEQDADGHEVAKSVVGLGTAVIGQTTSAAGVVINTAVSGTASFVASAADAVVGAVRGGDKPTVDTTAAAVRTGHATVDAGHAAIATGAATAADARAEGRSKQPTPKEVAERLGAPFPDIMDVGCVHVHQGLETKTGLGYLKIIGTGEEITDEGISKMMDFFDAFMYSPNATNGFSITYDLRSLRSPSMSMILRVAEWGNEPTRQAMWQTLNVECRVCVSSGMRYTISKAALSGFFYICPPVCRTYLLTDPDDNLEEAVVFLPGDVAETAPEDTPKRSQQDLQAAFKQKVSSEITDEVGKMQGDGTKQSWLVQEMNQMMAFYEEIMQGDLNMPMTPANVDPHAWVFMNHSW